MKIEQVKREQHYAVRFGQWMLTGRVDAIDEIAGKVIVWTEDLGYRTVSPSSVMYECRSPDEYRSIVAKRKHESWLRQQAWRRRYELQQQTAPVPKWPQHREAIIRRQGSVFHAGDYGISRET